MCTLVIFSFASFSRPAAAPSNWHRYMALLPPAVRMRYAFDLYPKGGATHALLDQTMICGQSISALTREVGQVCTVDALNLFQRACLQNLVHFFS